MRSGHIAAGSEATWRTARAEPDQVSNESLHSGYDVVAFPGAHVQLDQEIRSRAQLNQQGFFDAVTNLFDDFGQMYVGALEHLGFRVYSPKVLVYSSYDS